MVYSQLSLISQTTAQNSAKEISPPNPCQEQRKRLLPIGIYPASDTDSEG